MTRLVKHDAQSPKEVKIGNETMWACMCGLSNNKPFCDGSHKKAKDEKEGALYVYDNANNMVEIGGV